MKYALLAVGAFALGVSPAIAQNKSVKIGFVSTSADRQAFGQ